MDTFGVEIMKKSRSISELQLKALRLYDEFALFSDQCAFLCDAFAAVPAHQEAITPATLGGLHFISQWLKTRLVEIKIEPGQIHEQLREFEGV